MKLIQGKYNGFCFGVKSAVEAVEHALEKQKPVYILGPIIHNQAVVDRLEAKGAVTIDKVNQVPFGGTMVIRSHGVPPEVYRQCKQRNIAVIDATCPFVARIHEIVQNAEQKGIQVVIAGQKEHPEVVGINGFCQNRAWIVQDCGQAKALPEADKVLVVAQTTFVEERFEKIYQTLVEKYPEVLRENTICRATRQRQAEAAQLSEKCDAMVVIGGRHSSNTKKLAEICKNKCKNTIILESAAEFPVENLKLNGIIGIIAGASTPQWSIREVIARMNEQDLNTTVVEEQAPVEQAQAEAEATVAAQPAEPEEASVQ
ncbi:MAG: 4-hydroxy-3-methylbut-2-enyl diphosphate reductase, partial [Acutalibacteraceae bacterium]